MFSAIFLLATLIAGIWGVNVGGIPFSGSVTSRAVCGGARVESFSDHAIRKMPIAMRA
jgi:hypothetical protein